MTIKLIVLGQQVTLWSDWTPMANPLHDGLITEKRTRFICTITSLSNQQVPEIKSDKVTYRVCHNQGGSDCQETGKFVQRFSRRKFLLDSLDHAHVDDWSPWSVWSGK